MRKICPKCQNFMGDTFDNGILVCKCLVCGYKEPIGRENIGKNERINPEKLDMTYRLKKISEDLKNNKDRLIVISYLRSTREKKGLSQKQLADLFDFTVQRYGNVERHYNSPSIVAISQFAYVLNTPISELFKTMQISDTMYQDIKHIKINKSELVEYTELIECEKELEAAKNAGINYDDILKRYNSLLNSRDVFLKQGDVVDNLYWDKFIQMKGETYRKNNIRNL